MTVTEEWAQGPLPNEPSARIICDSITDDGHRYTTFEMKFHRFVLAEVNTHTLLSRNSESSRAVPYPVKRRNLVAGPALPIEWSGERPGMQGGVPLSPEEIKIIESIWLQLLDDVIHITDDLSHFDPDAKLRAKGHEPEWSTATALHKSLVNRLIEPWMWHTATVSAVDWEGFFAQRSWNHNKMAQPEFGVVAQIVEDLYRASEPTPVPKGGWHLPYIRSEERGKPISLLREISVGRCARTSYLTHTGERPNTEDLKLYNRLKNPDAGPQHASPFQHVATPEPRNEHTITINPADYDCEGEPKTLTVPIVGNARGWMQFRHIDLGW